MITVDTVLSEEVDVSHSVLRTFEVPTELVGWSEEMERVEVEVSVAVIADAGVVLARDDDINRLP